MTNMNNLSYKLFICDIIKIYLCRKYYFILLNLQATHMGHAEDMHVVCVCIKSFGRNICIYLGDYI